MRNVYRPTHQQQPTGAGEDVIPRQVCICPGKTVKDAVSLPIVLCVTLVFQPLPFLLRRSAVVRGPF